ncbi:MAG TPA: hypothetical protein VKW78_01290 [Terriglobales bacterium]|nr:hypothetical protein [Terriglobales bacterium]
MAKHLSLLFTLLLTLAVFSWAQSSSSTSSQASQSDTNHSAATGMNSQAENQTSSANSGNQKVLEGCIIRDRRDYYLEPISGQEVRLQGSQVGKHVNHHVRVHGTEEGASSAANNSGASSSMGSNAESSNANRPQEFIVTRVDMVSESCPANLRHRQHATGSQENGNNSGTGEANPK